MASKRLNGYWDDKKNVDSNIKKLIARLGRFPTERDMEVNNITCLGIAIRDHYGSKANARRAFGYKPLHTENGYFNIKENVDRELKRLIKKLGHFPNLEEMRENDLGNLHNVLRDHYGSKANARRAFGYKPLHTENGYFNIKENVDRELKRLIKKLGHFPSQKEMNKNGLSGISRAIRIHYKNTANARRAFGYEPPYRERGYFENKKNADKEINKLVKKLGHFPTYEEMKENDLTALSQSIRDHYGSTANARRAFGYEPPYRERGYFENKKNADKEINKLVKKLGHFPTREEMKENDLSGLSRAIRDHYGSTANAKSEFGFDKKGKISNLIELENLLERYAGEQNV